MVILGYFAANGLSVQISRFIRQILVKGLANKTKRIMSDSWLDKVLLHQCSGELDQFMIWFLQRFYQHPQIFLES